MRAPDPSGRAFTHAWLVFCPAGNVPKSRRGFVPEARREEEAQWGYGADEQRSIG